MNKKLLLLPIVAGISYLGLTGYTQGPYAGGAGNHTGSAGSTASCSGGGCHAANSTNTTVTIALSDGTTTPVTKYTPGKQYTVTLGGNNTASLPKFGFQVTCVKSAATSTQAGTFAVGTGTMGVRASTPQIIEHSAPIAGVAAGSYLTSFKWTAPVAGTGTVRFYAMLNAVNGTGTEAGDQPNGTTTEYAEATTAVSSVSNELAMTLFPNPANNNVHLKLVNAAVGNYAIAIYNANGAKVLQQDNDVNSSTQELTLNTSVLSAGTYFIQLSKDGQSSVKTFVKN